MVPTQRGTTVTVSGLFKPLPVRRKELERNAKREFGKALTLLHAYALVPCAKENKGVRLTVTNQTAGGCVRPIPHFDTRVGVNTDIDVRRDDRKKTVQLRTDGTPSTRASVSAIWGPKALENLVELEVRFAVEVEAAVLRRQGRARDDECVSPSALLLLCFGMAMNAGMLNTFGLALQELERGQSVRADIEVCGGVWAEWERSTVFLREWTAVCTDEGMVNGYRRCCMADWELDIARVEC